MFSRSDGDLPRHNNGQAGGGVVKRGPQPIMTAQGPARFSSNGCRRGQLIGSIAARWLSLDEMLDFELSRDVSSEGTRPR